jgi:hypothetical protein
VFFKMAPDVVVEAEMASLVEQIEVPIAEQ